MDKTAKIYVAGHRGLLGSALIRRLQAGGFTRLLVKTRAELDLKDREKTDRFFEQEKPEYVFLSAARVGGIQANLDAPVEFLIDNLAIQNNVLGSAAKHRVKKLLFVGSSCIYPTNAPNPLCEDSLLTGPFEASNEGYALAKAVGLRLCDYYRKQYGCDFITATPSNLFGKHDHYDLRKSHLLPALIMKIHQAKLEARHELEMWGTGTPRREFMLSDDCADALFFLMERYSAEGAVNVGLGSDFTIAELAMTVSEVLEHKVTLRFDTSKPDGMKRKLLDTSKMRAMGWAPSFSLKEGIRIAYQDYLDQLKEMKRAA